MKKICEHCGASMMVNKYSMNKTLVNALVKLFKNHGKKSKDVGFTKSEYAVYTKLKFWGLIAKTENEDGLWLVTRRGQQFLENKITVAKEVSYFRNEVKEFSELRTFCIDVFPTPESKQKYREMMEPA